jgi:hypothetical protein
MKKLISALIMLFFCVSVNAACDTKSLKGNYILSGTYTGYNGQYPTTCGELGIIYFNGAGVATTVGWETCGGKTTTSGEKITGTYSMDLLCSGSIYINGLVINFVFDRALKTAQAIGSSPNTSASGVGTLTKQ